MEKGNHFFAHGKLLLTGEYAVLDGALAIGDTFATWGWKNSNYFVVPLLGPSTVRDTAGNAITTVYPVKSAVFHTPAGRWSTTGLNIVNTREALLDLTDGLEDAAIDKYSYTRDLYMKVRSRQTGGTLPQGEDDNIDIDELVDSDAPGATDFAEPLPQSACCKDG